MPQALSYVPGVWMQKTNHGGGSAFVRGLTGYQTLLMIDGIRLNNSTYRSGPNQYLNTVDPLMISHVEVLRGSGSVQYGSDAIGGTIQLITKDPEFSKEGITISGSIYGKYWSEDMEKSTRAQVEVSSDKLAFLGGFTYKDLGDIKGGEDTGIQKPSGYNEYSVDIKGVYHIKSKHQLIGAFQHLKQSNIPLYHKIAPGGYTRHHFDPQQRDLAYLRLESFYRSKFASQIRYTVSYQNLLEVREKQKAGSPELVREEDKVRTIGANVDIVSEFSEIWNASSGVEYYHDGINSITRSNNQETLEMQVLRGLYPDDASYDNFAVFSMHSFDLNKWSLNAGLRYNLIRLQLEDSIFGNSTIKPDALVGNIGAVYKINHKHHISILVNSTFRAPNVNDVSSFGIADFRFEVPSYDLQPETSLNKELGYKIRAERYSAAFHVFHNKLNDLIANVPAQYDGLDSLEGVKVYRRENVNEAEIYGGEMELEGNIVGALYGYSTLLYTYGENISKEEPMRRIPPVYGRIGLKYDFQSPIRLRAEWIFSASQTRLSSADMADDRIADGGTPGWNVLNMYGSYSHRYFDIHASVQNIFNVSYRIHGSGIDGIGRSFWVSLMVHLNP
jgi:outer membrane receptor protein involved in Fe transport